MYNTKPLLSAALVGALFTTTLLPTALITAEAEATIECNAGDTVKAEAIHTIKTTNCPAGEVIVEIADGRTFALPEPGMSVELDTLTVEGAPRVDEVLVARTASGEVGVKVGEASFGTTAAKANLAMLTKAIEGQRPAAALPKCTNNSFATSPSGFAWTGGFTWRYNPANQPNPAAFNAIRSGAAAWSGTINACGLMATNSLKQVYAGTTSIKPGITSTAACGSHDGLNVIGWGPVSRTGGILAATCTWRVGTKPYSSDQIYNTLYPWSMSPALSCTTAHYDVQGVAAHEFGHSYGLAHVDGATGQTMKPTAKTCDLDMRKIGLGDSAGIKKLYP